MEHCLSLGQPNRMAIVLEEGDGHRGPAKISQSPLDDLDSLLASNSIAADDCELQSRQPLSGSPLNLEEYDTTLFCDTLASDTETVDEGSIEGEIEVSRPMADHWCETAYATVVRQDVSRIHKSVHTTYPVVKSIRLSSSKLEHPLRENGLMTELKFEPVLAEQVTPNESTLGYSSSETIYSTGTFLTKHTPRTYVDCLIHGSIDEFEKQSLSNPPPPAPVQQRTPSPPSNSHKVEQKPVQIVHQEIPVSRKTSSSLTDSGRNTQSADSHCTVGSPDASLLQNSQATSIGETPTNGSLVSTDRRSSDTIPYYPRRNPKRPLSLVNTPPRYDKSHCFACQKVVYPLEGVHVMDRVFHKSCFRCHKCQRILSVRTFIVGEGHPYCEPHYTELFRVRGRYGVTGRGKSAEDDDDFLLHQTAIQSSTSSETPKERPPPQVTRKLVAKFQGMSELSRSTQDLRIVRPLSLTPESPTTVTDVRSRSLSLGKQPIPTPFLQASSLQPREESPRKSQLLVEIREDSQLYGITNTDIELEYPHPGTTKDLIAMFSALATN